MMTSREQFEAWCTKRGLSTDTDSDCWGQQKYKYDRIQCMWEGWQASREAVDIKLPEVCAFNLCELLDKKQVIEAIRAAGIKVKGE
ncbi:hypothetical protein [Hafnia paralvei]|uniref:hypothetical protein n=1 Tax=Hafnia paralvei TaxID=546367 RepID=UPI0024BB49F3|nr:hypothetical protein [Hafnia paralvei]